MSFAHAKFQSIMQLRVDENFANESVGGGGGGGAGGGGDVGRRFPLLLN